ncbi:putative MATE efflux family protein [Hordeum vulgare]|nr:putative MATE efflux family protein [Hordeum vulgare]
MTASSAPLLLPRAPAPAAHDEVRRQVGLAAPLVACSLLQYNLQVVSVMFVGHFGELPLSAASVAASFANVTGFSVLNLLSETASRMNQTNSAISYTSNRLLKKKSSGKSSEIICVKQLHT